MDFAYEKKLKRKGYKIIVGVDEVGVGPLAGAVTAAAVTAPEFSIFNFPQYQSSQTRRYGARQFSNLRDSKSLTHKQREKFCQNFQRDKNIRWAVASVSPKVIDRVNIFEARRLAARRAVVKLEKAMGAKTDMIILDGRNILKLARKQEAVVRGDEKVALCAIASIIAKVTRDRAMLRYHKKYPKYRFDLHKGYGTKLHFLMLEKYGPCPIHRRSFRPVSSLIQFNGY